MNQTIAVLGAGHLGQNLLDLLIAKGHKNLIATKRDTSGLQEKYPQIEITDNATAAQKADILILTTKQDSFEQIAQEINPHRGPKLLISLGPTYSLAKLQSLFGSNLVRLMMTVHPSEDIINYCADHEAPLEILKYIFGPQIEQLPEEQMPITTAVVLLRGVANSFFEPLIQTAIDAGFSKAEAQKQLAALLHSTAREIAEDFSAEKRLRDASADLSSKSFTYQFYQKLLPLQQDLAGYFAETIQLLKKLEE